MRLLTADVDRYGPLTDWSPPCEQGVTVLSGPNEAGKSLYVEALLQLLDPAVAAELHPPPRVDEAPVGRVVVEHGGDQHELGDDRCLGDVCGVDASHLHSVFVVRDNDLRPTNEGVSEREYYTGLVETLGDIHTSEIGTIVDELVERGRLTPTTREVSSDRRYDDAGDVRDAARALAEDVRAYVAEIEEEGLDELEGRRLRRTRELRDARDRLREQEQAKLVADYEHLSDQLETYRSAGERLADLRAFDRETLDDLRELATRLDRDREELADLDARIQEATAEVDDLSAELREREERLAELERREEAVSDAESALATYRDRREAAAGAERRLALSRRVALAGLLAAGASGAAGAVAGSPAALALAVGLLIVSAAGSVAAYRTTRRLAAAGTARDRALGAARDAGLDASAIEDVGRAVESFEGDLAAARERATRTRQALETARGALDEREAEREDLAARVERRERELDERLATAGVETIDAFAERVERRESLRAERRTARQSLVDRFGEPDADEPAGAADEWERALEAILADVDREAVDADDYDPAERERLSTAVEELDADLDDLERRLAGHDDRLDEFDRRARELETGPFVDRPVALDARTGAGLEALAADLDAVVELIERDAELSRKAIEVFERIEAREERKLADLFDPDGPASASFERLTGGRYHAVTYDADAHEIVVERRDGRTLAPDRLSNGTRDQLYFASRVSLARQLLGAEPGFFLLDDPFLAADPERLHRGFASLQDLADDGWQILYLTAKGEVADAVDEYGFQHVEMGRTPVSKPD